MSKKLAREQRVYGLANLELREAAGAGERPTIAGYAAVFNTLSEPIELFGYRFREQIAPGAFKKTIKEADIRALWQHNSELPLGRSRNGTLRLTEDDHGLWVEIDPPDTQWGRDAVESIRRGDVSQMSFAFQVIDDEWQRGEGQEPDTRTLKEVRLYEVSPVTFPAYGDTEVGVRSLLSALSSAPGDVIDHAIEALRGQLAETGQPHSAPETAPTPASPAPGQVAAQRDRWLALTQRAIDIQRQLVAAKGGQA